MSTIMNFWFKQPNPDKLKKYLIDQVTGTVRWRESMQFAERAGVEKIIELGSGKVLTGIAKRMIKNIVTVNIENTEDFKNYDGELNVWINW